VHVLFDKGQSTLNPDARRAIRLAAAAYIGIGTEVVITGYADKTGNVAANVDLAKKRAQSVRDELVALGVEGKRIVLAAPADVTGSGSDEQARRVDVTMKQ
jgi:outer membrane protein OmpA-like peptidoglycan-associated protein